MRPGDTEYAVLAGYIVASMALASVIGQLIVRRDERRLPPDQLARAWPPSTRDSVLGLGALLGGVLPVAFGVLMHFVFTRRSWRGLAQGLFFAALVFVPILALGAALDLAFPNLPDGD